MVEAEAAAAAAAVVLRRKERRVEELYNATKLNTESEIVSALRGTCCTQVSADEMDQRNQKNMVPPKVNTKGESGNCNVCSAPCSSCMHLSATQMGLKKNEFSDETGSAALASQYSIIEDKTCDSSQHTHSEASNLLSVNSSYESHSENIESKATTRPSDASEDVGIQRIFSNKYDVSKGTGGTDDSSPCCKASDANAAFSCYNKDLDSKNSFCCSTLVCSLGSVDLSELPSVKGVDAVGGSLGIQRDKSAVGVCSEISTKIHPRSEADIDEEPLDKAGKSLNEDEHDLSNELVEIPGKVESPLQAASGDESCESVATEHDVKACDICGDAGREYLLAICSKCADGAEHTYCMREMLQKVPEGDWLCEECKLAEETESQKQGLDSEGKKVNRLSSSAQLLGKRHAENLEGGSASKKHVEPNMGSPKSLNPSKVAALSREGSFKNLDKGKVRPSPKLSLGNLSGNDMLEAVCSPTSCSRLQSPKRTLRKSNSFHALNFKPKVKLADEIPLQKQRIAGKHVSLDGKEEASRVMGKSMSFKSTNTGPLNTGESKFKILSSKYPHVQDLKELKQVKERISLERRNLSKLDRSSSSVSKPKVDQKLTPHADSMSHSSASNNRDTKAVRSDGKPSALSRSTSNLAHKVVKNAVISASGVPSTNGCISSEQKSNQVNLKEEPSSSSSWTAERQPSNIDGIISDGLSWSMASTSQSERMAHTADYCSVSQASGVDLSASRNLREEINKGNKLKATIEAVFRFRPGICERTSQDPLSVSVKAKNKISVEVAQSAVSKMLAIADHEYIWQIGKPPEFCGGIQAHLSILASPKVLEVVNTFPLEVPLNEVPRLNTWPTQFHNGGPKEDNIALYFFAKDLESYEKYYKVLMDTMVKNDLALKGNFDGVEFLIFPSNQLPQSCQRWNTLLFLWGVLKGRRNCSNSSKSVCIPDAIVTNAVEKTCISTERVGDNKVSSLEKTYAGIKANMEEQDGKIDTKYLSRISTSTIKVHPDMKSSSSVVICSSANGCSLKMSSSCCCS
ncbi:hypothetical protein V6N11_018988 [Hibiscus sabdariffa]|uniref:AIPP2-like SPOC-like domain-containing protein n=1 Tax=Hibiscus sabdariffa TaxID=183260 RepID=A0ABR2R1J9_9ROSI